MRWHQALTLAAILVAAPALATDIGPRVQPLGPAAGEYLPESLPRTAPAPNLTPVVAAPKTRAVLETECTKSVPTPADRRAGFLTYHVMFDQASHLFVVNAYSKLVIYNVTQIDGNDQWVVVRGETAAHTRFEATFKAHDESNVDERLSSFNPRTREYAVDKCEQMFE